jgi:hypothetical protein
VSCETPVLISNKVNIWREVEADRTGLVRPDDLEGTISLLETFLTMEEPEVQAMGEEPAQASGALPC